MKIIFLILIVIFSSLASAQVLYVTIKEDMSGNITALSYNVSEQPMHIDVEFSNKGSVAYNTRMRVDVFNGTYLTFTGWSDEKILMPGNRDIFRVSWYAIDTGNYTFRIKIYFGNEIFEKDMTLQMNITKKPKMKNIYNITNVKVFENYIRFTVDASQNVKDVTILPYRYTKGWIFEQVRLDEITGRETIVMPYVPTIWSEGVQNKVIFLIVNKDGTSYDALSVNLKRERTFEWLLDVLLTNLQKAFF